MKNNPFTSITYKTTWLKFFAVNKTVHDLEFIEGVQFIKSKFLPLFINLGRNNTNAITYRINPSATDYKGRVCLLYDVPNYIVLDNHTDFTSIKINMIKQYKGYILDLEKYADFDAYFNARFNKKSRSKFRGYVNRLEKSYTVRYENYHGSIDKQVYDDLMIQFKEILTKRFNNLGLDNDLLHKWDFYKALVYPMIMEETAMLNVVFLDEKVAAISLCFLSDDSAIGAIKTFDIDFNYFNVGNIEMMKLIEWCKNKDLSVFDFSKGDQPYKLRYINNNYHFDCHIIYDSKSIIATSLAICISRYFSLKQYLRDINVNLLFIKFKYILKKKFKKDNT